MTQIQTTTVEASILKGLAAIAKKASTEQEQVIEVQDRDSQSRMLVACDGRVLAAVSVDHDFPKVAIPAVLARAAATLKPEDGTLSVESSYDHPAEGSHDLPPEIQFRGSATAVVNGVSARSKLPQLAGLVSMIGGGRETVSLAIDVDLLTRAAKAICVGKSRLVVIEFDPKDENRAALVRPADGWQNFSVVARCSVGTKNEDGEEETKAVLIGGTAQEEPKASEEPVAGGSKS